eukprot:TRINITY_DN5106_c0_g1_i5.p1 TRINITY_DN5106_c0_g1~~TRINITY_DN5106_c0_g1_i5.p1  ORF type:complete len:187 (-),score=40.19 TRINITY_DN5106_c0_g1_i5:760-1320(-)
MAHLATGTHTQQQPTTGASKFHGTKEKIVGGIKESMGKITHNTLTETQGHEQKLAGQVEINAAKAEHGSHHHRLPGCCAPATDGNSHHHAAAATCTTVGTHGQHHDQTTTFTQQYNTMDVPITTQVELSGTPSKAHGTKQKMVGDVKEIIGKAAHDPVQQLEGHEQKVAGMAEVDAAKARKNAHAH